MDSAVENNFDFNRGEDWVTYCQVKRKVDTINNFICKTKFEVTREKMHIGVRNSCHCTGRFKHVSHSLCNLGYCTPNKILVDIQN